MPKPKPNEEKEAFISRFMSSEKAKKDYPETEQRLAVANSMWQEHKKEKKERVCLSNLQVKEDDSGDIIVTGLVATTHPDRVGDILSKGAVKQIVDYINTIDTIGDQNGAYRSVSLFHDWIKEDDPTLDEAAFLRPTARFVELDDGNYGAEVDAVLNKYYRGDMEFDEIKYRIDNKQIAGFSIEYNTDNENSKNISYNGKEYRYIDSLTEFGGVGLARARMIANPHAVIYKEIEEEVRKMEEEKPNVPAEEAKVEEQPKPEVQPQEEKKEEVVDSKEADAEEKKDESEDKEDSEKVESKELSMKELEDKIKKEIMDEIQIKSKIIKKNEEDDEKMETKEKNIPLSIKEMKSALNSNNIFDFKEAASNYMLENKERFDMALQTTGIPLKTTMKVKCHGNKLKIVGGLQIKSVLDQDTNPGAYTESIVEFADLFIPGIIETFNNQANLFGALNKRDHLMGGSTYGWRIKTNQASTLSVDPDDTSVTFDPVNKLKLRTDIKEYRVGVSVTDYVLHHGRATLGDILMMEAELRMGDMMRDLNNDLFTEQVDTAGNKVLGLEAVADSAGNTSMYGKTRSTANRLAPAAAGDTYQEVGGAVTTALLREAARKVETEGAMRQNLRYIMHPKQRDAIFELEDGNLRYFQKPDLGFSGQFFFDGIPVIVDSSCQDDAVFVVDFESYYIVMSRAPQMIGLAKVGAAESAYISTYLAAVYEQPRRIHMLNTLS